MLQPTVSPGASPVDVAVREPPDDAHERGGDDDHPPAIHSDDDRMPATRSDDDHVVAPGCAELSAADFPWFKMPETPAEWAALEAVLANPPEGGWTSQAEIKGQELLLGFDLAVMGPTVRARASELLMGPTLVRVGLGGLGPSAGGLTLDSSSRRSRPDRGSRRAMPAKPSQANPGQARPNLTNVGPISGATLLATAPDAGPDPVLLPTGLAAAVPEYALPPYRACVLDVLNQLAEAGDEWTPINADAAKVRYGHPRLPDGRRPWVWPTVQRDLLRLGIIEVWSSATSTASYRPGACSKAYRLGPLWRAVEGLEVIARTAAELLPEPELVVPTRDDGSLVEVGPWLERCVETVEFDLLGALRAIFERYGIAEPDTLELQPVLDAIKTSTAPPETLADIEEERAKDDKRPALVIARAQAESRVRTLWSWRVRGRTRCYRDPAGFRLHTPITRLPRELRPFLTFGGERLVSIDAKNSQMCLLARAALKGTNGSAYAIDFADVCAAGQFYEETFHAVHGRYPTPAERQAWKSEVMAVWLYARSGCMRHESRAQLIGQRWKSVHVWVWAQKFDGPRDLPCRMQREEAAIWIDQLGPELERIGCPGVTAHDSVFVPASREAEVRALLERLYAAEGVRATFA